MHNNTLKLFKKWQDNGKSDDKNVYRVVIYKYDRKKEPTKYKIRQIQGEFIGLSQEKIGPDSLTTANTHYDWQQERFEKKVCKRVHYSDLILINEIDEDAD